MLKFEDIKKSSVYITPNFPVLQTKRYKFGFFRVLGALIIYSLIVSFITILLLVFTPAKQIVMLFENKELTTQAARVQDLEEKVVLLSRELQSLQSTNKRLKFAMILAGADTLDSASVIYDSLKKEAAIVPNGGGNILFVFKDFFKKFFKSDSFEKTVTFIKPVNGFVLKNYSENDGHLGLDFGVKNGSPVYASSSGVVIFADFTINEGYVIIIKHDDEYLSMYKHCSSILKKERDFVLQGELIALSGNTGHNSSGPHLHFEIWKGGTTVDPEKLLINK